MKKIHTKSNVFLSSLVGLVMITGLVHARALESNIEDGIFLRPDISPYISYSLEESDEQKSTSSLFVDEQERGSTSIDQEYTSNSYVSESQFVTFLKEGLSTSSLPNQNGNDIRSLINTLRNKFRFSVRDQKATISDIIIQTNSSSSVTLLWELDKFADVTIYYSTSTDVQVNKQAQSVKVSAFKFMNQVTINELVADTNYNYLVVTNYKNKDSISLRGSWRTAPQ